MKTKTPPATGQDRKALHAYCTDKAHTQWHETCAEQRVSVSAMLEALAPALPDIFDALPDLVAEAGRIESARRRRAR